MTFLAVPEGIGDVSPLFPKHGFKKLLTHNKWVYYYSPVNNQSKSITLRKFQEVGYPAVMCNYVSVFAGVKLERGSMEPEERNISKLGYVTFLEPDGELLADIDAFAEMMSPNFKSAVEIELIRAPAVVLGLRNESEICNWAHCAAFIDGKLDGDRQKDLSEIYRLKKLLGG